MDNKDRKVFQVWIGEEPSIQILNFMQNVKKLHSDYTLIASENFLDAPKFVDVDIYSSRIMREYPDWIKFWITKKYDPRILSDAIRLLYLSENPFHAYLDCDAYLTKEFYTSEKARAYFAEYQDGGDVHVIVGTGDNSIFKMLLNNIKTLAEASSAPLFSFLRSWPTLVPSNCFYHLGKSI